LANRSSKTIADQVGTTQIIIGNTLNDPEIQDRVAAYGYTQVVMNNGKQLYAAAVAALNAQIAAAGALRDATVGRKVAKATAQIAFQDLSQVARAAFARDKHRLTALGLTGVMPRKSAPFLVAAFTLFDNSLKLPEMQTALAIYGYDPTRLQNERAKITAYENTNQAQEAAKGAARQATRDQDVALKVLHDWVSQFVKIAKVALRDKKELLGKLGVVNSGTGRSTKKSTEKPTPAEEPANG
jgi:hypothetical protein